METLVKSLGNSIPNQRIILPHHLGEGICSEIFQNYEEVRKERHFSSSIFDISDRLDYINIWSGVILSELDALKNYGLRLPTNLKDIQKLLMKSKKIAYHQINLGLIVGRRYDGEFGNLIKKQDKQIENSCIGTLFLYPNLKISNCWGNDNSKMYLEGEDDSVRGIKLSIRNETFETLREGIDGEAYERLARTYLNYQTGILYPNNSSEIYRLYLERTNLKVDQNIEDKENIVFINEKYHPHKRQMRLFED